MREAILTAASPAKSEENALQSVEDLVHAHTGLVFRIAYSVLRNHHDAEDAAQEVFMRVLRYRSKLTGVEDAKSWLAQIAWRVAVERHGRRKQAEGPEAFAHLASQATSAEKTMSDGEMLSLLERFIGEMEPELRDAITLKTVQELNSREIASVLGIPEATVRTRQMRARQILKERFTAVLGTSESGL